MASTKPEQTGRGGVIGMRCALGRVYAVRVSGDWQGRKRSLVQSIGIRIIQREDT